MQNPKQYEGKTKQNVGENKKKKENKQKKERQNKKTKINEKTAKKNKNRKKKTHGKAIVLSPCVLEYLLIYILKSHSPILSGKKKKNKASNFAPIPWYILVTTKLLKNQSKRVSYIKKKNHFSIIFNL